MTEDISDLATPAVEDISDLATASDISDIALPESTGVTPQQGLNTIDDSWVGDATAHVNPFTRGEKNSAQFTKNLINKKVEKSKEYFKKGNIPMGLLSGGAAEGLALASPVIGAMTMAGDMYKGVSNYANKTLSGIVNTPFPHKGGYYTSMAQDWAGFPFGKERPMANEAVGDLALMAGGLYGSGLNKAAGNAFSDMGLNTLKQNIGKNNRAIEKMVKKDLEDAGGTYTDRQQKMAVNAKLDDITSGLVAHDVLAPGNFAATSLNIDAKIAEIEKVRSRFMDRKSVNTADDMIKNLQEAKKAIDAANVKKASGTTAALEMFAPMVTGKLLESVIPGAGTAGDILGLAIPSIHQLPKTMGQGRLADLLNKTGGFLGGDVRNQLGRNYVAEIRDVLAGPTASRSQPKFYPDMAQSPTGHFSALSGANPTILQRLSDFNRNLGEGGGINLSIQGKTLGEMLGNEKGAVRLPGGAKPLEGVRIPYRSGRGPESSYRGLGKGDKPDIDIDVRAQQIAKVIGESRDKGFIGTIAPQPLNYLTLKQAHKLRDLKDYFHAGGWDMKKYDDIMDLIKVADEPVNRMPLYTGHANAHISRIARERLLGKKTFFKFDPEQAVYVKPENIPDYVGLDYLKNFFETKE